MPRNNAGAEVAVVGGLQMTGLRRGITLGDPRLGDRCARLEEGPVVAVFHLLDHRFDLAEVGAAVRCHAQHHLGELVVERVGEEAHVDACRVGGGGCQTGFMSGSR